MSKKAIQIISLVLSIAALIYLVLAYYGIIRYIKLHATPTESYIGNYTKLPKESKDRVTICFAANVEELGKLNPFINSILDQTVRVDDIGLTIPYKDMEKVPENLKKVLSMYGYSKDYEDAGNLICSVLREPEANTKIIVVEPDMVYGQDFVESMIEASEKSPDKIIYADKSKQPKWGILLKPKFFDDKISDYEKGKGCCPWLEECCQVGNETIDYSPTYKKWL
jgi:hypothetical protein